ncbi:MAG: hypothetical protein OXF79_29290 [Chloroflexi bacterium]|nr:hypothetical protein [Chloroflexota bacterium]
MTMAMERPIVDSMFTNRDDLDPIALLAPTIEKLTHLDYLGWRAQLAADGFTNERVDELETMLQDWIGSMDRDSLSKALTSVTDVYDEDERERVVTDWLEAISPSSIVAPITLAQFPNELDALCYAVSRLGHVIYSAVSFEFARRQMSEEPSRDLTMTPAQISEGIALAESGLEEDSKAWPCY